MLLQGQLLLIRMELQASRAYKLCMKLSLRLRQCQPAGPGCCCSH